MDEKNERSIWDEVDALKEKEENVTSEATFTVINSSQNGQNEETKQNKETRSSSGEYKMYFEKDDNAEKKGLISIIAIAACLVLFVASTVGIVFTIVNRNKDIKNSQSEMDRLRNLKELAETEDSLSGGAESIWDELLDGKKSQNSKDISGVMDKYKDIYNENNDFIGWLTIDETVIDYPVMQTPDDEEYYLHRGFDKQYSENGCLIMDTDSNVGVGTKDSGYNGGKDKPSTNLIIHGHTMKNGDMFGDLDLYEKKDYADAHKIIKFDSLYESREYEVIAVFYSQVYYTTDECFKYYKFFEATNEEEFDDWYTNIKDLALFDTGVEAEFGDEFITLSCCAYHVEDGRFVVVGKRIK